MRKTVFTFGLIFLLGIAVIFVLQDVLMLLGFDQFYTLIFILPQVVFLLLLFLVVVQLYKS